MSVTQISDGRHLLVLARCNCGASKWARKSSVLRAQRQGRQWMCPSCAHRHVGAIGNAARWGRA